MGEQEDWISDYEIIQWLFMKTQSVFLWHSSMSADHISKSVPMQFSLEKLLAFLSILLFWPCYFFIHSLFSNRDLILWPLMEVQ